MNACIEINDLSGKRAKGDRGFTLVELLASIALVSVLMAAVVPLFLNITKQSDETRDNAQAVNIAQQILAIIEPQLRNATEGKVSGHVDPNDPSASITIYRTIPTVGAEQGNRSETWPDVEWNLAGSYLKATASSGDVVGSFDQVKTLVVSPGETGETCKVTVQVQVGTGDPQTLSSEVVPRVGTCEKS